MRNEEHQNYVQLSRERITHGMHVSIHTAGTKLSFLITTAFYIINYSNRLKIPVPLRVLNFYVI